MTIDDVLKLVNAGFTAQQIAAMTAAQAPEPKPEKTTIIESSPSTDEPTGTDPTPAEAPEPDYMGLINQRFDDLMSSLKGQLTPSIADVKPLGVEDIITKFFKED